MTAKHKKPFHQHEDQNGPSDDDNLLDIDNQEDEELEESADDQEKGPEADQALSELKDKHLRLLAEFDNFKKRTSRERFELLNTASKNVLVALLPVLDDFDRAMKSAEKSADDSLAEGLRMIHHRFLNVVQAQGLHAMESTGETFDPDLHEAITEAPAQDPAMKGKVIDTIEKGYFLNDKIIRHAKVVVGS